MTSAPSRNEQVLIMECVMRNQSKQLFILLVFLGSFISAVVNAAERELQRLQINGAELEYEMSGAGEPVLLIHGTGVAATFFPTMTQPALAGYQLIRFHRRGFAGSDRAPTGHTIMDDAADAIALLQALGINKAHIVGHSYGGAVALQMALDAPDLVHDLVVMEPPIFDANAPSGVFSQLIAQYDSGDAIGAMSNFSRMSYGEDWQSLASRVPGGPDQVLRDAETVFTSEAQAMMTWGFTEEDASQINQPMVYVTGGGGHGASRGQLQEWTPRVMDVIVVPGTTHAMLMEDPAGVADAIADFISRYPF